MVYTMGNKLTKLIRGLDYYRFFDPHFDIF